MQGAFPPPGHRPGGGSGRVPPQPLTPPPGIAPVKGGDAPRPPRAAPHRPHLTATPRETPVWLGRFHLGSVPNFVKRSALPGWAPWRNPLPYSRGAILCPISVVFALRCDVSGLLVVQRLR
jgi:hypothetical protein